MKFEDYEVKDMAEMIVMQIESLNEKREDALKPLREQYDKEEAEILNSLKAKYEPKVNSVNEKFDEKEKRLKSLLRKIKIQSGMKNIEVNVAKKPATTKMTQTQIDETAEGLYREILKHHDNKKELSKVLKKVEKIAKHDKPKQKNP